VGRGHPPLRTRASPRLSWSLLQESVPGGKLSVFVLSAGLPSYIQASLAVGGQGPGMHPRSLQSRQCWLLGLLRKWAGRGAVYCLPTPTSTAPRPKKHHTTPHPVQIMWHVLDPEGLLIHPL
jgi:hypothetical protein